MSLVLDLPDPKRSDQNTFASYGLFLISFYLNLVVFFLFLLARVVLGGFAADGFLRLLPQRCFCFFGACCGCLFFGHGGVGFLGEFCFAGGFGVYFLRLNGAVGDSVWCWIFDVVKPGFGETD